MNITLKVARLITFKHRLLFLVFVAALITTIPTLPPEYFTKNKSCESLCETFSAQRNDFLASGNDNPNTLQFIHLGYVPSFDNSWIPSSLLYAAPEMAGHILAEIPHIPLYVLFCTLKITPNP